MSDGYRYRIVDVFTQSALEGNALAVFPDGAAIDERLMQPIAREMNLSETVFILPSTRPDCAQRLRIFTTMQELRFAGHPTVGAAWVLLDESMVPQGASQFSLDELVGPVPVRRDAEGLIWLTTPAITFGPTYDPGLCADALGLHRADLLDFPPQMVGAGNRMIFVPLRNNEAVDRASLDLQGYRRMKGADAQPAGVFVFAPRPEGAYSRMFAPELGVVEDPATGSATGPLAAFMMRHGLALSAPGTRWISEQGTKMGRRSLLHVHIAPDNAIEVGGHVTPVAEGVLRV